MFKNLIQKNNSSLIYSCDILQFKRLLLEENLSINELNSLRTIFEQHNKKSDAFSYVVQDFIDKKINIVNEKIAKCYERK